MFVASSNGVGDCKGWTFMLPAVSVGNAAQIAVDLLLASPTFEFEKVGYWYGPSVVPVACNDPLATKPKDQEGKVALSVEFYRSSKLKVVVMQRRSPLVKGGVKTFVSGIMKWAIKQEFGLVLLASSSQAYLNEKSQMERGWWTGVNLPPKLKKIMSAVVIPFRTCLEEEKEEKKTVKAKNSDPTGLELLKYNTEITRNLIMTCQKLKIPMLSVLAQVNEGDNLSDGIYLCMSLVAMLQMIEDPPVKINMSQFPFVPLAYRHAYGPEPDQTLYA
mmetsp:Transcript_17892/g.26791  ORF Transcript_17892/g.26791 Transcript_17892/m.26791 type:complete len:274 (+) Transcript_17892:6-827(+)